MIVANIDRGVSSAASDGGSYNSIHVALATVIALQLFDVFVRLLFAFAALFLT